jgi:hypothetical protein
MKLQVIVKGKWQEIPSNHWFILGISDRGIRVNYLGKELIFYRSYLWFHGNYRLSFL